MAVTVSGTSPVAMYLETASCHAERQNQEKVFLSVTQKSFKVLFETLPQSFDQILFSCTQVYSCIKVNCNKTVFYIYPL